jgi:hypothetical protein
MPSFPGSGMFGIWSRTRGRQFRPVRPPCMPVLVMSVRVPKWKVTGSSATPELLGDFRKVGHDTLSA